MLEHCTPVKSSHTISNMSEIETGQHTFNKCFTGLSSVIHFDYFHNLHLESLEAKRLKLDPVECFFKYSWRYWCLSKQSVYVSAQLCHEKSQILTYILIKQPARVCCGCVVTSRASIGYLVAERCSTCECIWAELIIVLSTNKIELNC